MKLIKQLFIKHALKLKNTFWIVSEDVLRRALNFLLLIFLTRYLGVVQFGMLSYALNFLPMLPPLVALGTDKLTLQALIHHPKARNSIVGTALFIRSFMGILLIPVVFFMAGQLQPQDALMRWLVIIATSGVAFESSNVLAFWFQAKGRFDQVALARILGFSIALIWRFILIINKASLIVFVWSYLGERLLVLLSLLFFFKLSGGRPLAWKLDLKLAGDLIRKGSAIMFTQIVIMLYLYLDVILLQHFSGTRAVGIYSLANKLCEPLRFLGLAVVLAFSPALIHTYKKIKEDYWRKLGELSAVLCAAAYLLIIGSLFLSRPLIMFIFGQEYAESALILNYLVLLVFFVYFGDLKETTLILEKQQFFYFLCMTGTLLLSLVLNFQLIPVYGVLGMVWTKLMVGAFFDLLVLPLYPPTRRLAWVLISSLLLLPLFKKVRKISE